MKDLKDLKDLLGQEVQVLYDAENLLLNGLEKMHLKSTNPDLKLVFEQHLEDTRIHKNRLEHICSILKIKTYGEEFSAMKGLIVESEKFMYKNCNAETLDAALIAAAQKIEHYEIAGYGTAAYFAEELGLYEVAELLHKTLEEEKHTNIRLNDLAKYKINLKAENATY